MRVRNDFPPDFFDSMENFPIHLAKEEILDGPVQHRWMYLFERVDKASNSLEQSLVATNDLSLDGAGFASTITNDEVDNNDPFYKRRFGMSIELCSLFSFSTGLVRNSNQVNFGVVYVHLVVEFGGVLFMFFQFVDVAALYQCWRGL
ncbi:hypothetical protein KIW84_076795 [Lathyrus oleraceus]|uniref:DUF4218 domain-containing protein n=1 Tax=Pisum sativum TaxID=3888 RepID=A0A9D4VXG5_PEA|nr:hypothetical protein KIW84_076795 [Pisum sativum]